MKAIAVILALMPTLCYAQWTQVGSSLNGQTVGERFGGSAAISADGSIMAIAARDNASGGPNAGQVSVFSYSGGDWTQLGAAINGESSGDQTGASISLSDDGSVLAIGEPFNNDLGFVTGQVRVFAYSSDTWTQLGSDLFGQTLQAAAGTSVDLSADGTIVAVGAPNTEAAGVSFAGNVRVFEFLGGNWVQKGGDLEGDGTIIKFGTSVSLSADGNTLAIGHTGDPTRGDTGRVKVYRHIGGLWTQTGQTIFSTAENDEFGYRVSLSSAGDVLAIGTYGKGEVKVFEWMDPSWTQMGSTLVGDNAGDAFGFSLSLSGDGSVLAVGARFISLANDQPGSAYVFENQGGEWVRVDDPIVGVGPGDQTGFSVAISQNGSRVVVGATGNDEAGSNAGQVRVFDNTAVLHVDQLEAIPFVEIVPNPATDFIQVHSKETMVSYSICSLEGKVLRQSGALKATDLSIDVNDLVPGLYVLTFQTERGQGTFRIVKQ